MLEEKSFTDPERWEYGDFDWEPKYCYTVSFSCFLGKPSKVFEAVQQMKTEIAQKGYIVGDESMLLMEIKTFSGRLLLEIQKPKDYDAAVIEIEKSKAYSTIHNGPLKTIGKSVKEFKQKVANKGLEPNATYYWDFRHGPDLQGQNPNKFVIFCRV